jgi:hypothetical protein
MVRHRRGLFERAAVLRPVSLLGYFRARQTYRCKPNQPGRVLAWELAL